VILYRGGDTTAIGGPYFDDLAVGQVFDWAPAVTLTSGMAAVHQAILGDRLRLSLDRELAAAVVGSSDALAHPALVCDVAIGQSTLATQRVKANLFYRGLVFRRYPVIGDALSTRTEVVGLRPNTPKPGRAPSGMAALRMTTVDQAGRQVLDFFRCAMLPCSSDWESDGAEGDDLTGIGRYSGAEHGFDSPDPTAEWDADEFRRRVPGPHFDGPHFDGPDCANPDFDGPDSEAILAGTVWRSTADVVSSAPELARLTLNIAAVHHDSRVSGTRLVYGGHTIGLALAQATRLLPNIATVLGWESCDHTGPVHEGDTVYSEVHVDGAERLPEGRGGVLTLRSVVYVADAAGPDRQVLEWRFNALCF
jgi:acyl dehydratase